MTKPDTHFLLGLLPCWWNCVHYGNTHRLNNIPSSISSFNLFIFLFYFILFYFILFYFILFYFILFYFILLIDQHVNSFLNTACWKNQRRIQLSVSSRDTWTFCLLLICFCCTSILLVEREVSTKMLVHVNTQIKFVFFKMLTEVDNVFICTYKRCLIHDSALGIWHLCIVINRVVADYYKRHISVIAPALRTTGSRCP